MVEGHCEICGNFSSKISTYFIEGAPMEVCPDCRMFGSAFKSPAQLRAIHAKLNSSEYKNRVKEFISEEKKRYANKFSLESGERVIDECSEIIRKIVQKNQWTNEEFAKKLNEKESYVSQIVSGRMRPSIEVAKKIERMFNVKLVETFDLSTAGSPAATTRGNSTNFDRMTMADLFKEAMQKKK